MEINKKYLYFKRWFKTTERSIYCGQWSDEQIAHAGFTEGIKYKSELSLLQEQGEEKEQILSDFASKISTKSLYDDPELAEASNKAVNAMISEMKYIKKNFTIKPTYATGVATAVETYHVVDESGSIWLEGTFTDCQNYLKSNQ